MESTTNNTTPPDFVAVKTEPYGFSILIPAHEVEIYQGLVDSVVQTFRPDTFHEKLLAQSIADTEWRLRRIRLILTAGEGRIEAKMLATLQRQVRYFEKRIATERKQLQRMVDERRKTKYNGLFVVPKKS